MNRKAEQEDIDSLKAEVLAKVETIARETKITTDEHNDRLDSHENLINQQWSNFQEINQTRQELLDDLTKAVVDNTQVDYNDMFSK